MWNTDVPLQKNQIAILNTIEIPETSNSSKMITSSIFDCINRCIFNLFTLYPGLVELSIENATML